jgi:hypothetical protein
MRPGESLRIFIVAPALEEGGAVKLHTRRQGALPWQTFTAVHAGRDVYVSQLGPFDAVDGTIEYYATATGKPQPLSDPPQAPVNVYTMNLLA